MNTSAVAMEPMVFSPEEATAWFTILEAQFHLAQITVGTAKFYHALAALPPITVVGIAPQTMMN